MQIVAKRERKREWVKLLLLWALCGHERLHFLGQLIISRPLSAQTDCIAWSVSLILFLQTECTTSSAFASESPLFKSENKQLQNCNFATDARMRASCVDVVVRMRWFRRHELRPGQNLVNERKKKNSVSCLATLSLHFAHVFPIYSCWEVNLKRYMGSAKNFTTDNRICIHDFFYWIYKEN